MATKLNFTNHCDDNPLSFSVVGSSLLTALALLEAELCSYTGVEISPLEEDMAVDLKEMVASLGDGERTYQRLDFSTPEDNFTVTAEEVEVPVVKVDRETILSGVLVNRREVIQILEALQYSVHPANAELIEYLLKRSGKEFSQKERAIAVKVKIALAADEMPGLDDDTECHGLDSSQMTFSEDGGIWLNTWTFYRLGDIPGVEVDEDSNEEEEE
jgi:hypothetical protein